MPAIVCGTVVVGALALRWVTGSWAAALAAVAAVVLSQVVLLGLISWQGRAMDMSLSIVPPLMMALGFSYAAHRALRRRVAPVLIVCGVTAVAGVASSAFAPLVPVRLFGLYGTIGLLLVWLATWTLVPFAAGRMPRTAWFRGALRLLLRNVARPRPARAAAVAAVVLAAGVAAMPFLTFSSSPLRYFPTCARVRRDFDELDRKLTGMLPFQITVYGDARADAMALISASPGVRKVIDISRLVSDAPGQTLWCLADNDALPELVRQQERWLSWGDDNRVELAWRGVAAQLAAAERAVTRNAVVSIPSMCVLGGAGMWLVRRRIASVALGAVAAFLPVAAMVAVVALARIPVGLPSLLIGAICVGLSVDDTLHLVAAASRYRSVRRATVACFRPCVGSSLTNALCASMFVMSPLAPVRQFGLLTAGAVLSGMLANQLLVPHVLGWHRVATAFAPAERAKLAPPSAAAI
jgi:predicted RND superfamily exporter protein